MVNPALPLVRPMVNCSMLVPEGLQCLFSVMCIGRNCRALRYVFLDHGQRAEATFIRNDLAAKCALAFNHPEDDCLVLEVGTLATPALELPADVRFVHFDVPRQRPRMLCLCPCGHQVAQLVSAAPRALVCHAKLAL